MDIDGLKQINDSFGHHTGNQALVDTANVLRESFRESDVTARLGGDEFAIFIAEGDDQRIRGRILQKLAAHNHAAGRDFVLSFSVGIVAGHSAPEAGIEDLLAKADSLMYQQKREKRSARSTY